MKVSAKSKQTTEAYPWRVARTSHVSEIIVPTSRLPANRHDLPRALDTTAAKRQTDGTRTLFRGRRMLKTKMVPSYNANPGSIF